jgi:hypothetical protein
MTWDVMRHGQPPVAGSGKNEESFLDGKVNLLPPSPIIAFLPPPPPTMVAICRPSYVRTITLTKERRGNEGDDVSRSLSILKEINSIQDYNHEQDPRPRKS